MTADEYLALGQTQERYELIDGVVVMSPSSAPGHGEIAAQITGQLIAFSERAGIIRVFSEIDVRVSETEVVRPDICAYLTERLPQRPRRFESPPDLIVEILSPGTRAVVLITKRDDYEKFGVAEYWAVEPADGRVRCWQRRGVHLVEAVVQGDSLPCEAIPGFVLDLRRLRRLAQQ
jgi:Uma2 family endonuclease